VKKKHIQGSIVASWPVEGPSPMAMAAAAGRRAEPQAPVWYCCITYNQEDNENEKEPLH